MEISKTNKPKKERAIVRRCEYCYNLIWREQKTSGKFCDQHCAYEGRMFENRLKENAKKEQLKKIMTS